MAFSDWLVEVQSVIAQPNNEVNPVTGTAIDPKGRQQSRVNIKMTHIPSGEVFQKGEIFVMPSKPAFKKYAQDVSAVIELGMAGQPTKDAPSSLLGILDITDPVAVHVDPTPDEIALADFSKIAVQLVAAEKLSSRGDEEATAQVEISKANLDRAYKSGTPSQQVSFDRVIAQVL